MNLPQIPKISLTLEKSKSILDGITLLELIDINCLHAIINSNHLSGRFDIKNYSQKLASQLYANEKNQLQEYLLNHDKKINAIKVVYKKPRHKYGRVYPDRSLGLTSLSKKVRNTLIRGKYIDIDLSNAQPKIIWNICKSNNIECPNLEKYILERDNILNEVSSTYSVTRNDAKNLFIRMAFLGEFTKWAEELNLSYTIPTPFITDIKSELIFIAENIKKHNPVLFEMCRKQKEAKNETNFLGSMFSYYLQDYETQIMGCAIHWISTTTTIMDLKNTNLKVCTYEYDGFKLIEENVTAYGGVDLLINNLQKAILDELGFEMNFEVKPIDKFFEIEYTPYVPPLTKEELKIQKEQEKVLELQQKKITKDQTKEQKQLTKNQEQQKKHELKIQQLQEKHDLKLEQEQIKQRELDAKKQKEDELLENNSVANNDMECAKYIIKILGDNIKYTNGTIFYKDGNIWTNDIAIIESMLTIFIMEKSPLKSGFYGLTAGYTNLSSVKPVIKTIFAYITQQEDVTLYNKFHSTTKGRMAFKDGVLCASTNKFYLWHEIDFEYYTTICINREFNDYLLNPNFELMEEIKKTIFEPLFGKKCELALNFISRALMGHTEDKNWATFVGNRDSGKGMSYELIKTACEKYLGSFKLDNILLQREGNGKETAKDSYWLLELEFMRLAIAQETPNAKDNYKISGSLLKKLASGGDTQIARRNYDRKDTHFIIDATLFIFGNSSLDCSTSDCNEHRFEFESKIQFKHESQINTLIKYNLPQNVKDEHFGIINTKLKEKCQSIEWGNAFILMIMKYYKKQPLSVIQNTAIEGEEEIPLICKIFEKYNITKDIKDIILAGDIERDLDADKKKITSELTSLGVIKQKYKGGNKNFRDKMCYLGIKEKIELEPVESDDEM